jgi:hypothetical protein
MPLHLNEQRNGDWVIVDIASKQSIVYLKHADYGLLPARRRERPPAFSCRPPDR